MERPDSWSVVRQFHLVRLSGWRAQTRGPPARGKSRHPFFLFRSRVKSIGFLTIPHSGFGVLFGVLCAVNRTVIALSSGTTDKR